MEYKNFNKENYAIVDTIGVVAIMAMEGVRPTEIIENGRLRSGKKKNSAVYLKDKEYLNIIKKINNGEYNLYKYYNRICGKCRDMLITKNINVLN